MTTPNPETLFVQKALAAVEKSEKIHRYKLIAIQVLAFAAAAWFGIFRQVQLDRYLGVECTVIIMVGMIAGVCTAKIRYQMDQNTKAILQAIGETKKEDRPGGPPYTARIL